jgi:hypothetical protein
LIAGKEAASIKFAIAFPAETFPFQKIQGDFTPGNLLWP